MGSDLIWKLGMFSKLRIMLNFPHVFRSTDVDQQRMISSILQINIFAAILLFIVTIILTVYKLYGRMSKTTEESNRNELQVSQVYIHTSIPVISL